MREKNTRAAAILFSRALLGIIFLMQGYGKIFVITLSKVYDMFFKVFEATFLPKPLIWFTLYYTSYTELLCGIFLIIGLFKNCALYLLAINLLIVSFGHGLIEPVWDLQHVMPRAILLIALLLLPKEWDRWHADRLLAKTRS